MQVRLQLLEQITNRHSHDGQAAFMYDDETPSHYMLLLVFSPSSWSSRVPDCAREARPATGYVIAYLVVGPRGLPLQCLLTPGVQCHNLHSHTLYET
nr:hypothetical protein CFP56_03749 [Quercus suber]